METKGYWWISQEIAKVLSLPAGSSAKLDGSQKCWLQKAGLDMVSVQLSRAGGRSRFFLMRAHGQQPDME
jgi:hypothetical protein